jgi:hypothetical protein
LGAAINCWLGGFIVEALALIRAVCGDAGREVFLTDETAGDTDGEAVPGVGSAGDATPSKGDADGEAAPGAGPPGDATPSECAGPGSGGAAAMVGPLLVLDSRSAIGRIDWLATAIDPITTKPRATLNVRRKPGEVQR